MTRRAAAAAVTLATLVGGCGGSHRTTPDPPDPADPMVHARALDAIARTHHGTRAAGTSGDAATADYIADRLAAAGFAVRRHRLDVLTSRIDRPATLAVDGGRVETLPLQFTGSGDVTGPLRAARGYGCARADYAGLPRGAVAVARRGNCYLRVKALRAQEAGAGALLIRAAHPISGTLVRPGVRIPVLAIGRDAPRAGTARAAVGASTRRASTENVIGELRTGSAHRVLMAGAHLDSVPTGPGVNDDGSGISALLAIAVRLHRRPPAGRVRLGFWAAEEIGLVGSWRYAHRLSRAERDAIPAYLNLDMVASPHPARLVYGDPEVTGVLRRHLPRSRPTDIGANSDHASFQDVGVPAGGLFTGEQPAQDPCYHRACDTIANVNPGALRSMTDAAEASIRDLAAAG